MILDPISALNDQVSITRDGQKAHLIFQRIWSLLLRRLDQITPSAATATGDVAITGYVTVTLKDGTTVKIPTVA